MFFFLSKTLSYLLKPLVIITGLFVLSWTLKNPKWKKRLFITAISLLLFFSNDFIANEVMRAWEIRLTRFDDIKKKYEYGILLCGVAKIEVEPRDRVYIGAAADRVNHTLELYKRGFIRKILISGGSGRLFNVDEKEADQLSSLLQIMGVPREDILIENLSRNTHESAVEVQKMLAGITTRDQCILITSAFHMRRSIACFNKVGWSTDHFCADIWSHNRNFYPDTLIVPKTEAIAVWNLLLKEWMGYISYSLVGYI